MKKLITLIIVLALTVCAVGTVVSAHGGHHRGSGGCGNTKVKTVYRCAEDCTYCDDDGDGVCDNCGNYGYYCEKGCAFTDEDQDGICDNCDTKGVCSYKPKARSKRCCH